MTTPARTHLPRRSFLKQSAAAGAALAAGAPLSARPIEKISSAPARNIIFMVSDGMSTGSLTLADMYIRRSEGRSSRWVEMWSKPGIRRAMCSTFAANSLVTDSAAAASAWGIGEQCNNGAVCLTPDERQPEPILVRARTHGLATGLVTTTRLTHATPAGFIANVPRRNMENQIAAQILERHVDVAFGGGWQHFKDLVLDDLTVIRTRDELLSLRSDGRVLGLFTDSHMSYDIERPEQEPSLAEMTGKALELLAQKPRGFIMQIEGGRVDHAAHNNDAASLVRDQVAFDQAVGVALDFAASRDDTLLIITTDHGNANPGLTLYGRRGNEGFERLRSARRSFSWIRRELRSRDEPSAEVLREIVEHATGIALEPEELDIVLRARGGEQTHPFAPSSAFYPMLGAVLANHFGIAFCSPNHTADYVEVTAAGPGSELLAPMIANTDLHTLMLAAIGLPAAR